jgi:hypothetical protein
MRNGAFSPGTLTWTDGFLSRLPPAGLPRVGALDVPARNAQVTDPMRLQLHGSGLDRTRGPVGGGAPRSRGVATALSPSSASRAARGGMGSTAGR